MERGPEWGASEGNTFDLDKSELIHFTRKKKDGNPPISVTLLDGRHLTVQPAEKGSSLRWLGVQFDRRLTFKNHVSMLSAKASSVIIGLRLLVNTV